MHWTRRDFVRAVSFGVVAGSLPAFARPAPGRFPEFIELRRNAGIFTSEMGGTIGWLVNPDGIVVVDSQFPDTARDCLHGLRDRGRGDVDALINTHHHGDHVAGNGVFRPVTRQIVAHERVPEFQRAAAREQGTADEQTYPDTTFADSWTIEVGDERIHAHHYGRAHTGGDATVHFERANVVHLGDLVFEGFHPFIDRPGGASIQGWIERLETVADEYSRDTIFIFGHAQPGYEITGPVHHLQKQRDYLVELLETARRAIDEGLPREGAVQAGDLSGFEDYVAPVDFISLEAALGAAYDELAGKG